MPPAPKGTTIFRGLLGKLTAVWAFAEVEKDKATAVSSVPKKGNKGSSGLFIVKILFFEGIHVNRVYEIEITRIRLAVMQTLVIFLHEYKEY